MYFYRGRYYSPTLQRFISEDPIGIAGGINLYAYVGNDAINFGDPFGHDKHHRAPSPCQAKWGMDVTCNSSGLPVHGGGIQPVGGPPLFVAGFAGGLVAGGFDAGAGAAGDLASANPVGSAVQDDLYHSAANSVRPLVGDAGTQFQVVGADGETYTLTQVPGSVNGVDGRFEYLVDSQGNLTHQFFVPGGGINGIPIKP